MSETHPPLSDHLLAESLAAFRKLKHTAERAMAQLTLEELQASLDSESNSVAILVKHMAGCMRSRWTDFLHSDGEKPDRERDREFIDPATDRNELMTDWESGWNALFTALEPLKGEQLQFTVTIRGEAHTVVQAMLRQYSHYAYHVGQIVMLAKHWRGDRWENLSIPKGSSEAFTRNLRASQEGAQSNGS